VGTKRKAATSSVFIKSAVVVCLFGLIITPFLLYQASSNKMYPAFSKPLIGSLYAATCLLGILAVFQPKNCQRAFMFNPLWLIQEKDDSAEDLSEKIPFAGHHPDCLHFSPTRIKIGKSTLCASCAGLLIGALAALFGTALYFFVGDSLTLPNLAAILVSYAGLVLGLGQFRLSGYVKLAANAWFVFGSFLILATADTMRASLLIDFYVLGLIVFLLVTRISISEWNNKKICCECGKCLLRQEP